MKHPRKDWGHEMLLRRLQAEARHPGRMPPPYAPGRPPVPPDGLAARALRALRERSPAPDRTGEAKAYWDAWAEVCRAGYTPPDDG